MGTRNLIAFLGLSATLVAQQRAGRYEPITLSFEAAAAPANPYRELTAAAKVTRPGGGIWNVPLFWDGGRTWKLRLSPDAVGRWSYSVNSADSGLNGRSGSFECTESARPGGLVVHKSSPSHFARQNGKPVYFLADTAWGYFSDSPEDNHHRAQAEHYAKTRASQGFNAIHVMGMSEQGVGNNRGLPFTDISQEQINPAYWQEVDERIAYANRAGLTVGIALAWADKRKVEPFAWRKLPTIEARKRYARYIGARYGAYDVYFLVSGEWHGEIRTRDNADPEVVFAEFVELGDVLEKADPHDRMIGIHPMTAHGSVREFVPAASWMSFGDYQQNYRHLHDRILMSRHLPGPVVNSEYGYLLRDSNGDGLPDKSNSYSTEDMRFSSWDIVTAGGYLVNGFGTTYFAGHRDPGPFDVDAAKNDEWERQIGYIRSFFEQTQWWNLYPADALLSSKAERGPDRPAPNQREGAARSDVRPPAVAYWAMANPGSAYVIYVRGTTEPVTLEISARPRRYDIRQFNPRTGEYKSTGASVVKDRWIYTPPDTSDWVVLLEAAR
jgi:hypothetical protein